MNGLVKKVLCLVMVIAMLSSLFAGCGKEPLSSPTDVVPERVVTPLDKETAEDTSRVVSKAEESDPSSSKLPTASQAPSSNGSSGEEIINTPVDSYIPAPPSKEEPQPISIVFRSIYGDQYTGETGMGKLWKDHFGKMAEKGILTSFSEIDSDTAVDTIFKEVLAGKATTDVYEVSLKMSHQLAVKRVLANVLDSKTLNQKAFDTGGTHSNTINGKTYGVSLSANTQVMMLLYNKEFIKRYAPTVNIAELVEQNKWNWETFRDLAKKCTVDTDGDRKTNYYAIASNDKLIQGILFAGAGGYGVMKEGKITSTLDYLGEGYHALSFAKTLFKTDRTWKYFGKDEDAWASFANQQVAMTTVSSQELADRVQRTPFDCGIAPLPSKDQTKACNGVMETKVFVVPKTKENHLDEIGKWLNGVSKAENTLIEQQTHGLRNHEVTLYQWVLRNTSAQYSAGVVDGVIISQVNSLVTAQCKCPADSRYKAVHSHLQRMLDDFYAPLYEDENV